MYVDILTLLWIASNNERETTTSSIIGNELLLGTQQRQSSAQQILLHNYALAYYGWGHVSRITVLSSSSRNSNNSTTGGSGGAEPHWETAVCLWEHALGILTRFYHCFCHRYLQPTACLVSIAILHCLIPLGHPCVSHPQQQQSQIFKESPTLQPSTASSDVVNNCGSHNDTVDTSQVNHRHSHHRHSHHHHPHQMEVQHGTLNTDSTVAADAAAIRITTLLQWCCSIVWCSQSSVLSTDRRPVASAA